jgi:hypothetical protein
MQNSVIESTIYIHCSHHAISVCRVPLKPIEGGTEQQFRVPMVDPDGKCVIPVVWYHCWRAGSDHMPAEPSL